MLMLRLSCPSPRQQAIHLLSVLPCRYLDSLGSLSLARGFSGHLIIDAHVCPEVPLLGRHALRSYLKLCCVSVLCG